MVAPAVIIAAAAVIFVLSPLRQILYPEKTGSIKDIITGISAGRVYLEVTFDKLIYTGYDYYTGSKPQASYYYYLDEKNAENPCIFVLIPVSGLSEPPKSLSDYRAKAKLIRNDDAFGSFIAKFSKDIGWSEDALKSACMNTLLSSWDYKPFVYGAMAALLLFAAVICILYLLANFAFFLYPPLHPAARRLEKFGLDSSDFSAIDEELKNPIISSVELYATDHFFIAFKKRSIYIVPLFNIIWAYKFSAFRPFAGRKNYTLVIVTSPESRLSIGGNRKGDADAILRVFMMDFTHIIVGYRESIKKTMEKKS